MWQQFNSNLISKVASTDIGMQALFSRFLCLAFGPIRASALWKLQAYIDKPLNFFIKSIINRKIFKLGMVIPNSIFCPPPHYATGL